jgi:hypothetical protein
MSQQSCVESSFHQNKPFKAKKRTFIIIKRGENPKKLEQNHKEGSQADVNECRSHRRRHSETAVLSNFILFLCRRLQCSFFIKCFLINRLGLMDAPSKEKRSLKNDSGKNGRGDDKLLLAG